MAGTAVIRTAPVASITPQNFDGNTAPAENTYSLTGDMKNGLQAASFIIFSSGFTSNADQLVAAGSQIVGNSMSISTSDDTVKGPFHASAISNFVGPVTSQILRLYIEDGTNGAYFEISGYRSGWRQLIGCPSNTPDGGTALSLTATVTHAGIYGDSTVGGESMFELVATAISWCGREITVDGGTSTVGNEITFEAIALADVSATRTTTAPFTGNFYGHVTDAGGLIRLKGPVQIGDAASTNNTYMLVVNTVCLWDDAPVHTKFYRIDITKNGASSTCTVIWGASASPAPVTIDVGGTTLRWALFTAGTTAQEPTEFSAYGCTLKRGRAWELGSTTTIDGGVLQDITDITMDVDAEILNVQMIDVKLIYGLPPVAGQLTGSTFSSPSTFCMTVATQTANMTVDYEFDSTCRGAGLAIEFTHTSGNILITASAGYYQPVLADVTVSGAGTVSFPAGTPVTTAVKTVDNLGVNVASVRIIIKAATGGALPYQDSVTITRSGTTATVTHTGHGMITGDKIDIAGITDKTEDNIIKAITFVNANSYTYTTTNSGSTSYTGSIIVTFIALEGLTDASGDLSVSRIYGSSQVIEGSARKSTISPFFKAAGIPGTVSNTLGYSQTITMISDE